MIPPPGLLQTPIAHRGLWRGGGAPENSLAAFEAAVRAGYGIELDVRLSEDGEAVVFHDDTLERMTADAGLVEERTAGDLTGLRLLGSDQTLPRLSEVLDRVGGRVMVLAELKTPPGQEGLLERRVAQLLAGLPNVGVLSFNASALAWMAAHAPDILRGLNAETPAQLSEGAPAARPHFLSVALPLAPDPAVQAWRRTGTAICWTVKTPADQARLASVADNIIFEGFAA